MSERVVVAGGGMSGLAAAEELEKQGFEVLVIDENSEHVYRPSLPSIINGKDLENICFDTEKILENTNIKLVEEKIDSFDPESKSVETSENSYSYDYLVVGLGGEVKEPDFSLSLTEDFYSKESAEKAVEALEDADSATVIGAGYIGVEVALRLDSKDIDVTLVDSSTRPLSKENDSVSESILELLNRREISFMAGRKVFSAHSFGVEFEDDGDKESDVVIWCGGIQSPEIVQRDFNTGENGVEVNKGLSAVNFENVYAIGRCAATEGNSRALESVKQGRKAADNISKKDGLLDDYEHKDGFRYICSPDSTVMVKGDSAFSGEYLSVLGRVDELRYRNRIWRKRKLREMQISLDPILSLMD